MLHCSIIFPSLLNCPIGTTCEKNEAVLGKNSFSSQLPTRPTIINIAANANPINAVPLSIDSVVAVVVVVVNSVLSVALVVVVVVIELVLLQLPLISK